MLLNINKTKLNVALILSLVLLSILTISWHHQMYLLYTQSKRIETQNHQLTALHKQLLIEQSQTISGSTIKAKALKMQAPKRQRELLL
ncbi:cell division protein FtsL [Candidatus Ruthia endofausta]|uniref:Cell division protein FtsL n=1 Tax=Candidatus Ruthia endofausta TaxID=2738852 RepID=A0A6N0HNC9_9GAMM|nr:cell division protein FtsL [Candidatus Ruthia endofausta]QKQ23787.1 cell division protein FtsL [Candidatus Ruthia endofausta]